MTKINDLILEMIKKNKSLNQICEETGLSSKQLFYRLYLLRIKGYDFINKYYYNGDIRYDINKDINNDNKKIIITDKNDTSFRAILISDLHLTNMNERIDLLDNVYNFAVNNNYNIIINAGDVIDGLIGRAHSKKISDVVKQIEYALKVYPYDKNILNFICLGNHDFDAFTQSGANIESVFNIKRHDLISLGYGYGRIGVKNDIITVVHPKCGTIPSNYIENGLVLEGHYHKMGFKESSGSRIIQVNSLSDLNKDIPAGFMTINIGFRNGMFYNANVESYLYFNNKFVVINEYTCNLGYGKNLSSTEILNEENYKTLTKNNRMSQIQKFNMRYDKSQSNKNND